LFFAMGSIYRVLLIWRNSIQWAGCELSGYVYWPGQPGC